MSVKKNLILALAALSILTAAVFLNSNVRTYAADKAVVTTGSNVRLRSSASLTGDILANLPKGAALTETGRSGEWASVKYGDKTGFVNTQFLADAGSNAASSGADAAAAATTPPAPVVPASGGGRIICIDPGHQGKGDNTREPIGPGSATTKARVTGGTHGTTSGLYEYQLTLAVGQLLQSELTSRGYTVYMTRTSHDVNISNMERAQYANSVGAAITIRLHANGANSASTAGALALAPSAANPYVGNLAKQSQLLSSKVISGYCAATGFANKGVQVNDTMTGINWCTMPVTIIEMGFMTNPSDDLNMANAEFQKKMAKGIADGVDAYFN